MLPAQKEVKISIPVREESEDTIEDVSFEEEILSDVRIDPKIRVICNKLLQQYMYCTGGFFIERP